MTILAWNDDRIEQLKNLWMDGLSASRIAAELGGNITRNAVIGKVHRLGLTGRVKTPSSAPHRRRPAVSRRRAERIRRVNETQPALVDEVVADIADTDIPDTQRCSLTQLTSSCCHWPVGDPAKPGFFFCGGNAPGDDPYCRRHQRLAYLPRQPRRTQTRNNGFSLRVALNGRV